MDVNKRLALSELCCIAHKRNELNSIRMRSLSKVSYWSDAVRRVKLPYYYAEYTPPSPKWVKMGLHKLRSLVLQYQYKYTKAKCDTMRLTIKTRTRVKQLSKETGYSLSYRNGYVDRIVFNNWGLGGRTASDRPPISRNEMAIMSEEYLAHLAVQKMLKD